MRVFLSWSKEPSLAVATVLRDWLPDVIQSLDPWMSGEDIPVGERWRNLVAQELEQRSFGILIVTPVNQSEPWLNFEAGALSKVVGQSRVVPYTVGLRPGDIPQSNPLSQFQGVEANASGTLRMLRDINSLLESPRTPQQIQRSFDRFWPALEDKLKGIIANEERRISDLGRNSPENSGRPMRPDSDKLDEILVLMRRFTSELNVKGLKGQLNLPTRLLSNQNRIDILVTTAKDLGIKILDCYTLGGEGGQKLVVKLASDPESFPTDEETVIDLARDLRFNDVHVIHAN